MLYGTEYIENWTKMTNANWCCCFFDNYNMSVRELLLYTTPYWLFTYKSSTYEFYYVAMSEA